jgi:hypothetical protein
MKREAHTPGTPYTLITFEYMPTFARHNLAGRKFGRKPRSTGDQPRSRSARPEWRPPPSSRRTAPASTERSPTRTQLLRARVIAV